MYSCISSLVSTAFCFIKVKSLINSEIFQPRSPIAPAITISNSNRHVNEANPLLKAVFSSECIETRKS